MTDENSDRAEFIGPDAVGLMAGLTSILHSGLLRQKGDLHEIEIAEPKSPPDGAPGVGAGSLGGSRGFRLFVVSGSIELPETDSTG